MTTIQQTAPKSDIQFNPGEGDVITTGKLRRLVQDVQKTEAALNTAINALNSLLNAPVAAVPPHVLATISGLDPDHTVSGLTVGQVLKAIAPDNAAFVQLELSDLKQMDIVDLQQGDALIFINGYWTPTPIDAVISVGGQNEGSGRGIYISTEDNVLLFKSLAAGTGVTLTDDGHTIQINSTAGPGGGGGYPPELGYAGII